MIKIIYASVTGNTEKVARYIEEKLKEHDLALEVISADETDISIFEDMNTYIIATSTWNLGQMNQFLEDLYSQLDAADLSGVRMAFIGLGDMVYGEENFCRSMLDFRDKAIARGAVEVLEPLKIDGDPDDMNAMGVDLWVQNLAELLLKNV